MKHDNNTKQLKYGVLSSVACPSYDNQLSEHLGGTPYKIIPGLQPAFRRCIYREREIIHGHVSAACGEDLSHQGDKAVMGVLPAACEGCPINRSNITDDCQRCLTRKCATACPFGAVSVIGRGAHTDSAKCKECGCCAAACPYNVVSDTMRPCLRSCPVNTVTMDKYRLVATDYSHCISCGACIVGCPFGAITDRLSMVSVIRETQSGEKMYVVFAPAIEGRFGTTNVGQPKEGLRRPGFADVVEVSLGADATAYHEAQESKEVIAEGKRMTTSCCPVFMGMVEKHFPKLELNISYTASPMTLTVRYLEEDEPDIKVVFFGSCVAKKPETQKAENTADYVMTFEELATMLSAKEIRVETLEVENTQDSSIKDKNFVVSGGVIAVVETALAEDGFDQSVSCVKCSSTKECKKQLTVMNVGRMQEDLIEGMACEGDCVAGPGNVELVRKLMKNRQRLLTAADKRGTKENLE